MKKLSYLQILSLIILFTSCINKKQASTEQALSASNPFLQKSSLPLQAPAFDKIKDADFEPAIEEGMKQQQAEIEKIASDTAAPTF
ncbi:peptidase M3, partial [Parabacteroides distasonis]|nr:peptidase M3 [Parabacteroides distasonis]